MSQREAWRTFIGQVTSTDFESLAGQRNIRWEAGNAYTWISNGYTGAISAGQVVFGSTNSYCAVTGTEIAYQRGQGGTTGESAALMLGVVPAGATTIPTGSYGWVQSFGYHGAILAQPTTAGIAAGDSVGSLSGASYVVDGVAAGTAPKYRNTIISLGVVASSVTVPTAMKGFIDCLH